MTEEPTKYLLTEEQVLLFVKSKEFKELEASGFSTWGSQKNWLDDVQAGNSEAIKQIIDFADKTEKQQNTNPVSPNSGAAKNPTPPPSDQEEEEEEEEEEAGNLPSPKLSPGVQKKASPNLSSGGQKKASKAKVLSPSGVKKLILQTQKKSAPKAGNVSFCDVADDDDIEWVEGKGLINSKGEKISFGGGSKLDASKTEKWYKKYNKLTGEPKVKPLSKSEIQEKRFHGVTQHEINHNNKYRRVPPDGSKFRAPPRSRQPFWETKPESCEEDIDYRYDLVRLWEQKDMDFSRIPNNPSTARDKAFRRLKKYNTLTPANPPVAETILLRHHVSRLSVAMSCLEKLLQQITVDTTDKTVLDSVRIARRVFADTMHPHFEQLAELDQLLFKTKRDSPDFLKKQKVLVQKLLKEMYNFPTFESPYTDTNLEEDPKHATFGKPLSIENFEKKCLELCKKKSVSKKPKPQKPKGPKGQKRKASAPGPKAKRTKTKKKKKQTRKEDEPFHCKVCNRWHGFKENYKCPKA